MNKYLPENKHLQIATTLHFYKVIIIAYKSVHDMPLVASWVD